MGYIRVNDIVKVKDWSYSLSCDLSKYAFENTIKGGHVLFRVIEFGVYPIDKSYDESWNQHSDFHIIPPPNNAMIEHLKSYTIFFINRRFLEPNGMSLPLFIEDFEFTTV